MKIRVIVERQSGPVSGAQLYYDFVIPEPDKDEITYPRGPIDTPELLHLAEKAHVARHRFIDSLSGNIARALSKGLEQALDGER